MTELNSYYQGRVLANESAVNDPILVSVLDDLARRNFTFESSTGVKRWNISDYH